MVALHRLRAAEDFHARHAGDDFRAHVRAAGIDADALTRHASLEERGGHAVGRPRLLRAWLEDEADLHRDDGQPKRVDAGRVRRQHETEHGRGRLITHHHAAAFVAVAARENVQRQPAREAVENLVHVREHEVVLRHVELAHVLGQAGGRGLLAREVVGRLRAVAHRQRGVAVEVGGLLEHLGEFLDGDIAEHLAGARSLADVLGEQAGVGLAHLGESLAGVEVDDLVVVNALVGLAPAQDRNFNHNSGGL